MVDAIVACMREAAGAAELEVGQSRRDRSWGARRGGRRRPGRLRAPATCPNGSIRCRSRPRSASASGWQARLGNDVSVATDAELLLGAGRGVSSLLGVFWGTGVGGGVVLDGKLWHGRGGAGEIGHMVVKQGGARCTCGRRGCMEAYAGRRAMEAQGASGSSRRATTPTCSRSCSERKRQTLSAACGRTRCEHEDKLAERLIERAVQALGAGVASAVNLLDVEVVLVGGGLGTRFGEPMLERIAAAMQPHLFKTISPRSCVWPRWATSAARSGRLLLVCERDA